ncbi:MAG: hypothetical protein C4308_02970 [Chitinophagaceae bacterium]
MNLEYKYLLDGSFHPDSKVWVYQASRLFSLGESLELEVLLKEFTANWQNHGAPVKAAGYLFFGQFIVLMADETVTGVGGCSTDSSVRFIKSLEQKFGVNLFDRTTLAFVVKNKVQLLPMNQVQYAFDNGFLTGETLYFNNVVQTKKELEEAWIVPVKNSWIAKRVLIQNTV